MSKTVTLFALSVLLVGFAVASPAGRCEELGGSVANAATAGAAGTVANSAAALVVFVFDKSCKISCNTVRPLIQELQKEYSGRVSFVELDVSKDSIKDSEKVAKSLGVASFLSETEDWYPAVGVFSAKKKLVKQILGAKTKDMYQAAIEKAIASNK